MKIPKTISRDDPARLTARQEELLVYFVNEILRTGLLPTIRDLCDKMEISSTNSIACHFDLLAKKGYVKRRDLRGRWMAVTDLGWEYVEVVNMFGPFERKKSD